MNYQEREEIFSKEALHIKDIQMVCGMKYSAAAKIIRDMKLKRKIQGKIVRFDVDGWIHTSDYLEELGFDPEHPGDRYIKPKEPPKRKSLCV